jgi:hypothetical protein
MISADFSAADLLIAQEMFEEIFSACHSRSKAYRRGAMDVLDYTFSKLKEKPEAPYIRGTEEFDEYFAGAALACVVLARKFKTGIWQP